MSDFTSGLLPTGDGHEIYWESGGRPDGLPAVFLHGGPGTGCNLGMRKMFDPEVYRWVLLDQRGCGRSRPLADRDLTGHTTQHLIEDLEALRRHLGIERWTVLGASWGSTLGLAYAQTYPERVQALLLALVTTTSRREVEWLTQDVGRVFPEPWERFTAGVPAGVRPVDDYARRLLDPDPNVHEPAAREWCLWEDAHVSLSPGAQPYARFQEPEFRLRFARLVTHYWRHHAFLEEDGLIREVHRLNGIPGALIHGRYDVSSPLETAWRLHRNWSTSRLHVLDDMGHGGASLGAAIGQALTDLRG